MSHRETILNLIKDNTVSATLRRRSGSRDEIRALQPSFKNTMDSMGLT
jgi:hypothetical protein